MNINKDDILKLIEKESKDNFWNHFVTIILQDSRIKGDIEKSKIKLWGRNQWIGIFYPVFILKLNAKNHLIEITDKLNLAGKIFYFGFILILLAIFLPIDSLDNWTSIWRVGLIVGTFMSIFIFATRKFYQFEKKQLLNQILELLEVEIEPETKEKPWSLKNNLLRIFTYPFCIFLIILNFYIIIPNGQYLLALGSMAIVTLYLVNDIKFILKK